VLIRV